MSDSSGVDNGRPDIVVVTHYFPAHGGGIELVAERLVEAYLARGFCVAWFASSGDAPPLRRERLDAIPIRSWNIIERLTQLPYPIWSPAGLRRLWREIGSARAVHIHEHLYFGSLLAIVIARMRGRRVVITQHVGDLPLARAWLTICYRAVTLGLAKITMRSVAAVAFVSRRVQDFFSASMPGLRPSLIYNGVDTSVFRFEGADSRARARAALGLGGHVPVALFVGRFVPKKGLHLIREMATRRADVQWFLVGSGQERPQHWGLPNVRVLGRLTTRELADVYRAADVLALPSRGEGFPLVVQEALACGCAVLTSEEVAAGCPEAASMLLQVAATDDGNAIDALLRQLARALGERTTASRLQRAERAAALWSWADCAEKHLDLLGLGNAKGRP